MHSEKHYAKKYMPQKLKSRQHIKSNGRVHCGKFYDICGEKYVYYKPNKFKRQSSRHIRKIKACKPRGVGLNENADNNGNGGYRNETDRQRV